MEYKLDKDKILKLINDSHEELRLIDKTIVEGNNVIIMTLNDDNIKQIKRGETTEVNPYMSLKEKHIRDILHYHFDECFEKWED